jgi:hypothetical protein
MGAESKYGMARIYFGRDSLAQSEKLVFELVNQVPSYGYWVAKSLVLLSDIYVKKEDYFQAKAVLESILNNYDGEEMKKVARERLSKIESLEKKEDQEQKPAPEMELDFEDTEINTDKIDALFEDEEIEELELTPADKPADKNEGGGDDKE